MPIITTYNTFSGVFLGVLECHERVNGVANDDDTTQPELAPSSLDIVEHRVWCERGGVHWPG